MKPTHHLPALILAVVSAACRADEPQRDRPSPDSPERRLLAYEATGLSLLRPYERGKVPVLFIHGLWSAPASWDAMIRSLEREPALKGRYQFWTFGYSTGEPIPYSAYLLRNALDDLRTRIDPGRTDRALDRLIVVGHSMGGLLAKMLAVSPGDRLWAAISDRPFADLAGDEADRELLRDGLKFSARPELRRVIFIATPHRGSHADRGVIGRLGTRLVRRQDPLQACHKRLVSRNPPEYFLRPFRDGLPTSIDELDEGSTLLKALADLPVEGARSHSIIAVRGGAGAGVRTDGLVRYASAHIEPVESELVVSTGHLCQDHPDVIAEVRRILREDDTR